MKDRIIGEIFIHPTMGTLKVVEFDFGCQGCVFNKRPGEYPCENDPDMRITGSCFETKRFDKKNVIFVNAKGGDNA